MRCEFLIDVRCYLSIGYDVETKADLFHDIEYIVAFRDACVTENGEEAAQSEGISCRSNPRK